ncbi:head-tail adaptor protein [Clostridium perfringens]|nr:head-tail adaptor protein [Clostridium perfringens]MDK0685136.1 head-tail adaptor protein [Clostridium perfringens]
MRKINIGSLNKKIIIQRLNNSINDNGIELDEWVNLYEKFASVKNSSYKKMEFLHEQGITSLQCNDFILRECDITYKDRIIFNNGIYDVKTEPVDLGNGFVLVTGVKLNG